MHISQTKNPDVLFAHVDFDDLALILKFEVGEDADAIRERFAEAAEMAVTTAAILKKDRLEKALATNVLEVDFRP